MNTQQRIVRTIGILAVFMLGYVIGMTSDRLQAEWVTVSGDDVSGFSTDSVSARPSETLANGGTTVQTANLSDGQRRILAAFGMHDSEVTITDEMMTCAEAEIGSARMLEIKNGDAPSFTEGAKLLACYR